MKPGLKTPTERLLLPDGVSAGAAIGAGGHHVRTIGSRHNVRCVVNPPQRMIEFLGRPTDVANAIADFLAVFDQILSNGVTEKFTPVNAAGETFVHLRAMPKTCDAWMFIRRDKESLKADIHTKHYEYILEHATTVVSGAVISSTSIEAQLPWVHEFNDSFRARMMNDVQTLCHEKPDHHIRLKAALGLTCFALRDRSLLTQTLSWAQVQGLGLVDQIQPRWSSTWNTTSPPVEALLTRLLAAATEQEATIKTTMTVYIGTKSAKNADDIVVKYHYIDQTWVPSSSLRPRRVLLAQYDIAANETQAFRIRAYSRDGGSQGPASCSIVDHLDVVPPPSGSHFLTRVEGRPTLQSTLFVRGVTVKDKLEVNCDGLRFVISYMNKRKTRVRIEWGLLDAHEADEPSEVGQLLQEVTKLMDKTIAITNVD